MSQPVPISARSSPKCMCQIKLKCICTRMLFDMRHWMQIPTGVCIECQDLNEVDFRKLNIHGGTKRIYRILRNKRIRLINAPPIVWGHNFRNNWQIFNPKPLLESSESPSMNSNIALWTRRCVYYAEYGMIIIFIKCNLYNVKQRARTNFYNQMAGKSLKCAKAEVF